MESIPRRKLLPIALLLLMTHPHDSQHHLVVIRRSIIPTRVVQPGSLWRDGLSAFAKLLIQFILLHSNNLSIFSKFIKTLHAFHFSWLFLASWSHSIKNLSLCSCLVNLIPIDLALIPWNSQAFFAVGWIFLHFLNISLNIICEFIKFGLRKYLFIF